MTARNLDFASRLLEVLGCLFLALKRRFPMKR